VRKVPEIVAAVNGPVACGFRLPNRAAENDSGLTTLDGVGGITSTIDLTDGNWSQVYHYDLKGAYTVTPNGRGTLTFSPPIEWPAVFWLISPTELVGVGTLDPLSATSTLLEYKK
jgi:hypothetical protein